MSIKSYLDNVHLAVIKDKDTGLYHGAVYRNVPTPSGSDRWLLSVTMNKGFLSLRDATTEINKAFPEIQPLKYELVAHVL